MTLLNITIYIIVNAILFFIVVPYIFSCLIFIFTSILSGNGFIKTIRVSVLAPLKHKESVITFEYTSIFLVVISVLGIFMVFVYNLVLL